MGGMLTTAVTFFVLIGMLAAVLAVLHKKRMQQQRRHADAEYLLHQTQAMVDQVEDRARAGDYEPAPYQDF